jgi:hypothetical protein
MDVKNVRARARFALTPSNAMAVASLTSAIYAINVLTATIASLILRTSTLRPTSYASFWTN